MGALAMPFENLPLGFRFKPTDVELIDHYLRLKINGKENDVACIKEVDICRVEPWDLPDLSAIKTNDHEWFFFCPRDRKYPNGQRSNRATEAGYWKATGKDRTIKSRKMGLIGMKKTLVFYTGRAPKGQRTNWVIHEYRTTLQELDGTHPGQGAFVLCRLFKKADDLKQDDNDDGSHTEEVETNICSPNPTNITHEDVRSEPAVIQASPLSVEQSVEQQMISENCVVKTSDSVTSETVFPDRPKVIEEMTPEVDSHFTEPSFFYDDLPSELYFKWQTMHEDQGPGCMDDIFSSKIGDGYNGLHLQDIDGGDHISDFLDSTLIMPDAPICKEAAHEGAMIVGSDMRKFSSIKESGSCSGSDVEVAQQQHGADFVYCMTDGKSYHEPNSNKEFFQNNFFNDDDDIFSDASLDRFCNLPSTAEPIYYNSPLPAGFVKAEDGTQIVGNNGIKIRSYNSRQPSTVNFTGQGTAQRRLRLLVNSISGDTEDSTIAPEVNYVSLEDSTIAPHDNYLCLEDLSENVAAADETGSSVNADEVVDTGIKIRTRLPRSRPGASDSVEQGTAGRRIRLQMQSATSAGAKKTLPKEIVEKQCADDSDGVLDQNPSSFKRPSPLRMVKVVMVVFLFLACFGLLIARSVLLLSS